MTDRAQELINLLIDGEATRDERAELEAKLASSPELQTSLEELQRVALQLERAAILDPPASLKDDILSRIQIASTVQPEPRPFSYTSFPASRRARRFAFGVALAAGILLAVLLTPALRNLTGLDTVNSGEVSGVMKAYEAEGWNTTHTFATEDQGLSVIVQQRDELVRLNPSIDGASTITVRWNPEALSLLAVNGRTEGRSTALVDCGGAGCDPLVFRFRRANRAARVDLADTENRKLGFLVELE